jgi:hypothetical protein
MFVGHSQFLYFKNFVSIDRLLWYYFFFLFQMFFTNGFQKRYVAHHYLILNRYVTHNNPNQHLKRVWIAHRYLILNRYVTHNNPNQHLKRGWILLFPQQFPRQYNQKSRLDLTRSISLLILYFNARFLFPLPTPDENNKKRN